MSSCFTIFAAAVFVLSCHLLFVSSEAEARRHRRVCHRRSTGQSAPRIRGVAPFTMEGVNWVPVYRLWRYRPDSDHFLTTSLDEANGDFGRGGADYEGIPFFVAWTRFDGAVMLYRFRSVDPRWDTDHSYTTTPDHPDGGYESEGFFGYIAGQDGPNLQPLYRAFYFDHNTFPRKARDTLLTVDVNEYENLPRLTPHGVWRQDGIIGYVPR